MERLKGRWALNSYIFRLVSVKQQQRQKPYIKNPKSSKFPPKKGYRPDKNIEKPLKRNTFIQRSAKTATRSCQIRERLLGLLLLLHRSGRHPAEDGRFSMGGFMACQHQHMVLLFFIWVLFFKTYHTLQHVFQPLFPLWSSKRCCCSYPPQTPYASQILVSPQKGHRLYESGDGRDRRKRPEPLQAGSVSALS